MYALISGMRRLKISSEYQNMNTSRNRIGILPGTEYEYF